jgi:NitT/TauT family transport system substrate-binding protein
MSRNLLLVIGSFVLVLLLTGCNKSSAPAEIPSSVATVASPPPVSAPSPAQVAAPVPAPAGPPLRIAYSDWPGWVAWDIGVKKGWFREAGVDVDFKWFDYAPSLDAYAAGKVDAVATTNGDALVTGSSGSPSVAIVINDFSNGNDMIVAKKGITSVAQLKGKNIGVEVGLVDHLLLLNALATAKLTAKDVKITNIKTDDAAQALKSGKVDAVAAWQPNSGAALREVPGSAAIFTSANVPGLIYDVLAVNPKSLTEHRAEWTKIVKVWFRIADFLKDEKNHDAAAKIMSTRVGLAPEAYEEQMRGTAFQDLAGNLAHYGEGDGLDSIYRSSRVVDDFNVKAAVYKANMKFKEYLDPSIVAEVSKAK